jgi:HNH endonuclease/helix-turn-helix protein
MAPPKVPIADRFWPKVKKTETCWLWTGGLDGSGYGHIVESRSVPGKVGTHRRASHVAWEIETGRPFPAGMRALHTCDNPTCVRFEHLFLGTQQDNIRDMDAKGRRQRRHPTTISKLTLEQAREIQARRAAGKSSYALAAEFGVNQSTISRICTGKRWRGI